MSRTSCVVARRWAFPWMTAAARALLAFGVLAGVAASALGQNGPPSQPAAAPVTAELVDRELKELEGTKELSDEAKSTARKWYEQARERLEAARKAAGRAAAFDKMARSAESSVAQAKEELEAEADIVPVETPFDADAAKIEQLLKQDEAALTTAKEELESLGAEPARRQSRQAEIRKLEAESRQRLAEIDAQLAAAPPEGQKPALTAARRIGLQVERQTQQQDLELFQKELAAYAATAQLLPIQRDLAARRVRQMESQVAQRSSLLDQRRRQDAAEQLRRARQEKARSHPLLAPLAEQNQSYAKRGQQLPPLIQAASLSLEQVRAAFETVQADFEGTQQKVDQIGLTYAIGLLLRQQLNRLPDLRETRQNIRDRRQEVQAVQLSLITLDNTRSQLGDLERQTDVELEGIAATGRPVSRIELRPSVRELLQQRKELLDTLIPMQNAYFDKLVELDSMEQQLVREVEAYSAYLHERVLWIRSAPIIAPADAKTAGEALLWIVGSGNWSEAAKVFAADSGGDLLAVGFLCVFVYLVYRQQRLRRRIAEVGRRAARSTCQRFWPTGEALLTTLLVSVLWPTLLFFLAWRFSIVQIQDSSFPQAISRGLAFAGAFWLALEFFRQMCRPLGLAESHFQWPAGIPGLLRKRLRWLIATGLPLVFVASALGAQDNVPWKNSLGRFCFLLLLIAVALFARSVLQPRGALFLGLAQRNPQSRIYRLRHACFLLGIVLPLSLAALGAVGYYYTARELAFCLQQSVWLLLVLLVIESLLLRWLLLNRRRIAIREAREQAAARSQPDGGDSASSSTISEWLEPEVDWTAISQQSRRLLYLILAVAAAAGLWLIWVDMLPALGILKRVGLWQVARPDGPESITLGHLAIAVVIGCVTFLAIKNIPGLLELLLLQRLPLDAGLRYAIIMIVRYAITITGLVLACGVIGVRWSDYQWLVAAATVGLGFGLQEIFANIVSGLIVLLERPVRVGDVVTVGDVTGAVSKIRMRATTLVNWDRQEYIVPNREFVTGRILNWTLSNATNRIVIKVGAAYDSDPERARELLLQAAREHPRILEDPAPLATFEGFGDNALDLVLRCYLPNLDDRLATIHELHTAIHRLFSEAGIEIAFPQQDIHVRSWSPPPDKAE